MNMLSKIAHIYDNLSFVMQEYCDTTHRFLIKDEFPNYKRFILIDRICGNTLININHYSASFSGDDDPTCLRIYGLSDGSPEKPVIKIPVSILRNLNDQPQDYMQLVLANDSKDIENIKNLYELDYLDSIIEYIESIKFNIPFNGFKNSRDENICL